MPSPTLHKDELISKLTEFSGFARKNTVWYFFPIKYLSRPTMLCNILRIVVICIALLSLPAFSFPVHRPVHRRQPTRSFTTSRSAFRWWFSDSPEDDTENDDLASNSTEIRLSEDVADVANVMEGLKRSQRVGERAEKVLQELSSTIVQGTGADGNVKVTYNGQQIPVGVQVDETYLKEVASKSSKEGVEELCLALITAMQDAHYKSGTKLEEKMKSFYEMD